MTTVCIGSSTSRPVFEPERAAARPAATSSPTVSVGGWPVGDRFDRAPSTEPSTGTEGVEFGDHHTVVPRQRQEGARLHDQASDVSLDAGIERLWRLVQKQQQAKGEELALDELMALTRSTTGNNIEPLIDREYFRSLDAALSGATRAIDIAMLTWDDGPVGQYFVDKIEQRMKEQPGLRVRIIVDKIGTVDDFGTSFFSFAAKRRQLDMFEGLKKLGAEVVVHQTLFGPRAMYELEHRKLVVADDVAFVSGTCLGDEYFFSHADRARIKAEIANGTTRLDELWQPGSEKANRLELPAIRDGGIRIEGPAVDFLRLGFLQSWLLHDRPLYEAETLETLRQACARSRSVAEPDSATSARPDLARTKVVHTLPGGNSEMGAVLIDLIGASTKSIKAEFPYILVHGCIDALAKAAQAGRDVSLIIPGPNGSDRRSTYWGFHKHYRRLVEAGVKIFEYDNYTHRKYMVIDGETEHPVTFTSTGNPEASSWDSGWDVIVLSEDKALAKRVQDEVFAPDSSPAFAHPVLLEELSNAGFMQRGWVGFMEWLFGTVAFGAVMGGSAPQPTNIIRRL